MSAVSPPLPYFGARYRVERQLGRGGMATVYLCTDTKLDRRVAIKLLHPDLAAAVGADRFHREIQIATGLTHPNILPAYDSGESDGSLYYVMPYVEGESLRHRMSREQQLPVQEAVRITCEIAGALQYAHSRGIVHRDIKPENILLEAQHAVLADFGIARAVTGSADAEALTKTGMSLGTPGYMSPEQALGEKNIDGRSDQYSLACVAYEMLTGQPPFVASTMQALVAKHLQEPVPLITTVRPAVPDELEDVILRALEKVPADRFAAIGDFADALANVVNTTGTWARRSTSVRTTTSHAHRSTRGTRAAIARRRSLWQYLGAAALGVTLVVGGVAWFRLRAPPRSTADLARVAVLYFSDDGNGGELRPLADGLTESLIEQLSQIQALEVRSVDAVLPWRGRRDISTDSIGRALRVGAVIAGSLEPTARGAKLEVRLLDALSGTRLGSKSIEFETSQVLEIQDSVANDVSAFLREQLGNEIRLRQRRAATRSTDAWMMLQRGERRLKDADSLLRAGAVGPALVALADADSQMRVAEAADGNWSAPPVLRASVAHVRAAAVRRDRAAAGAAVDSGLAYVERALRVDPLNADALEFKGKLLYFRVSNHLVVDGREVARTLAQAESTLTRAVSINRSQAGAWETLGQLHYRKPDIQAAIGAFFRAYESDAYLRSARSLLNRLFFASYSLEQFPEAMGWLERFQRRFPDDPLGIEGRQLMYWTKYQTPDLDSAVANAERYVQLSPESRREFARRKAQMHLAGVLARAGLADSARRVILRARAPSADIDPVRELSAIEAAVRVMLGDHDVAVERIRDYLTVNPDHRRGFANRTMWWWRDLQANRDFQTLIAGLQ